MDTVGSAVSARVGSQVYKRAVEKEKKGENGARAVPALRTWTILV